MTGLPLLLTVAAVLPFWGCYVYMLVPIMHI